MSAPTTAGDRDATSPTTFDVGLELQALLDRGIRCSLQIEPDGTYHARLGNYLRDTAVQEHVGTLEEALFWLKDRSGGNLGPTGPSASD